MDWNNLLKTCPKTIILLMEWEMRNHVLKDLKKQFKVTDYGFAINVLQTRASFSVNTDFKECWVCSWKRDNDDGYRWLYDFFDNQKFFVELVIGHRPLSKHERQTVFSFYCYHPITGYRINAPGLYHDSREEGEIKMFERLFEELEKGVTG